MHFVWIITALATVLEGGYIVVLYRHYRKEKKGNRYM